MHSNLNENHLTEDPPEVPLKGFPPNQPNLISAIAAEILKRVINFDVPPLTDDEDLVLNAEELFSALDEPDRVR